MGVSRLTEVHNRGLFEQSVAENAEEQAFFTTVEPNICNCRQIWCKGYTPGRGSGTEDENTVRNGAVHSDGPAGRKF